MLTYGLECSTLEESSLLHHTKRSRQLGWVIAKCVYVDLAALDMDAGVRPAECFQSVVQTCNN